jgi:uncharacterized protein YxjI
MLQEAILRYILKQKIFSIGGDFMIQDAGGADRYFVDGKAISLGRRLVIKDMDGDVAAVIQQHLISLTPAFEISRKGRPPATISRRFFSPIFDRLKVDLPGWDDLEVRGDLFDHEYTFYRGGRSVAQVSKRWISLVDAYGIDIADGEDDVLILASAVVIDEMLDQRSKVDG